MSIAKTMSVCSHKQCDKLATHVPSLNIPTHPPTKNYPHIIINLPLCYKHAHNYKPPNELHQHLLSQVHHVLANTPYSWTPNTTYFSTVRIGSEKHQKFITELKRRRKEEATE